MILASMREAVSNRTNSSLSFIRWLAPPDTWLKLNSDDSDHLHNLAACGGVLRDALVSFMRAFAANVGSCPVVVAAELWGACYALEVA